MSELAIALLFAAFVGPSPAPAAAPARGPGAAPPPAATERVAIADDVRESPRKAQRDAPKREGNAPASETARTGAR